MAAIVLWTALAVVAYVYVGYPIVLFLLAQIASKPVKKAPITPSVSMIIAAYNEEDAIAAKLDNSLALDYPPGLLEILVASDGSTDRTNAIVEQEYAGRATLLALPPSRPAHHWVKSSGAALSRVEVGSLAPLSVRRLPVLIALSAPPPAKCAASTARWATTSPCARPSSSSRAKRRKNAERPSRKAYRAICRLGGE